jgi:hypothetical protein
LSTDGDQVSGCANSIREIHGHTWSVASQSWFLVHPEPFNGDRHDARVVLKLKNR